MRTWKKVMGCGMSEVSPGKAIRELHSKAARIRQTFSELFDAPPAGRIVLVPSILTALHILFAKLQVRRIVLTSGEYYGALHFPAQRVETVGVKDLIKRTKELKPDVVMVSVVTWKGEVLPTAELFSEIRRMRGHEGTPLLVADYCHAGAVGFPSVKKLAADVVCGGAGKWVTPPEWNSKLGFLWFGSESLSSLAKTAFVPFFLATDRQPPFLVSRWIDPAEVRALHAWLVRRRLDRSALLAQYHADRKFASRLAAQFGIDGNQSNILWLSRGHSGDKRVRELERLGLTWKMPDGRTRMLCRAGAGLR
jgi:hypothetical protein